MTYAFLIFNAALYLVFSLWCALSPKSTARNVGFELLKGSGESEYLVVYGGLQLALAFFFLITALSPSMQRAGIIFAALLYVSLAGFRILSFFIYSDISRTTYVLSSIELLCAVIALYIYFTRS